MTSTDQRTIDAPGGRFGLNQQRSAKLPLPAAPSHMHVEGILIKHQRALQILCIDRSRFYPTNMHPRNLEHSPSEQVASSTPSPGKHPAGRIQAPSLPRPDPHQDQAPNAVQLKQRTATKSTPQCCAAATPSAVRINSRCMLQCGWERKCCRPRACREGLPGYYSGCCLAPGALLRPAAGSTARAGNPKRPRASPCSSLLEASAAPHPEYTP